MRVESLTDWASDQFDLSLKMHHTRTKTSLLGSKNKLFTIYNRELRESTSVNYRITGLGTFEWEQFREHKKASGLIESVRQYFPGSTSIREEDIPHPEDSYILILVVENLRTGETIELEGPSLNSPLSLWENTVRPESKISKPIDLINLLNPLEKGNIWEESPRYNNCLIPRELAKEDFNARFEKL